MSDPVDSKSYGDAAEVEASSGISPTEHAYDLDEKAKISDYKADAVEAENAEHNMGVLEPFESTRWLPFGRLSCPSRL
jgi:SP family general alpha glucoside:H+ symporter-like MFS transporter